MRLQQLEESRYGGSVTGLGSTSRGGGRGMGDWSTAGKGVWLDQSTGDLEVRLVS